MPNVIESSKTRYILVGPSSLDWPNVEYNV
mgnify:CR=1 FL=1